MEIDSSLFCIDSTMVDAWAGKKRTWEEKMLCSLMKRDRETMRFDLEEGYLWIVDNSLIPYPLRDYARSSGEKDFKGSLADITVLRDWLANRTLNLSRENAKVILNVTSLPQSLRTGDRIRIAMACRGLAMQDDYWIRREGEEDRFDGVCLRRRHLSEASYDVAILGHHISATAEELAPDLSTIGMFPKFWHRTESGTVELWKSDAFYGRVNSAAEAEASRLAIEAGAEAVRYRQEVRDGRTFSVSECIASDGLSMVTAQDVKDWCGHTGRTMEGLIRECFAAEFANMCIVDYVLANTDRHAENWGFLVDEDNSIVRFAPLYDFNQALLFDQAAQGRAELEELIYEPMGISFGEAVRKMAPAADVDFGKSEGLPGKCAERWERVKEAAGTPQHRRISA